MNRGTSLTYVLHTLDLFISREGHACVPLSHTEQDLRLGEAVDHLRKLRADGTLPVPVANRIQSKTGWHWSRGNVSAHRVIAAIGGFISLHGHTRFKPGSQLEALAKDFRTRLEAGALDRDTFSALDSFPQWRWEDGADRGWADRFRELAAFSEEQGHCRLSAESGRAQLAAWAMTQRKRFRTGELEPIRRHRMEMLAGWSWQPNKGMRERYIDELEKYVREHSTANVPPAYVTSDGFTLGVSLNRVRRLYARGELSPRRIAALEAVPGWEWDSGRIRKATTAEAIRAMEAFVQREGHADVPGDHFEDGFALGSYLTQARYRLRNGTIGHARLEQLDAVHPGWRRGARALEQSASTARGGVSLAA